MKKPVQWRFWVLLTPAVFVIKGGIYLLDPTPMFFPGDSFSYLYSAATGWIPFDRPYLY